ncbi:MAG: cell division protein ZapB [Thermodesulfobacteriota bacterium]|nr:cell division protein ZapB [Thermodesulfobacteriota bacterium]
MNESKGADVLAQFGEIEQRVGKLLEKIESLETANAKLNDSIAALEKDVKEKTEAEKRFEEERALMRSKIDALLAKIDRFVKMNNGNQAE